MWLWTGPLNTDGLAASLDVCVNNESRTVASGDFVDLTADERITLVPGVYHEFVPVTPECIIGELSTANDDTGDNFFVNPDVGRFLNIEEDEPPLLRLLSDP